ncbi:MAG: DUF4445 domain-containing protein [Lachnospiraceae bacterium]|nr:DUF4445 domain-containing protein [Lachnospiraceae bacterium]
MDKFQIAIDLGTTNIEIALCHEGKLIDSVIIGNRQSLFGSDVINRIAAVTRNSENYSAMRKMVTQDIQDAIYNLVESRGYNLQNVDIICVSGNATMASIFLGLDISTMGRFPFHCPITETKLIYAKDIWEDMFLPHTRLLVIKSADAFVGGDILSGIYYLSTVEKLGFNKETVSLFMDLGTNGEIILNNKGKLYGTSTACGPAFEGCTRKQKVYGYSTIEAISLCLKKGYVDYKGTLIDEYIDTGVSVSDVHIDRFILEQILMAKAGIYAGLEALINYAGLRIEDIEYLYISGGFGFNLNIDSAIDIGLIPAMLKDKVLIRGNKSLMGAIFIANDSGVSLDIIDKYKIDILQLANDNKFSEELINNMIFVRK